MSLTKYTHNDGDKFVTEQVDTGNQVAKIAGHIPYRHLTVTVSDGQLANDGTDTETVTINVADGLEISRGTEPANATVLDYDGDVSVSIDGVTTTKTLSNGTVSFNLTTDKPAGSTITVTAESLGDVPAENGSAAIEVVQA